MIMNALEALYELSGLATKESDYKFVFTHTGERAISVGLSI